MTLPAAPVEQGGVESSQVVDFTSPIVIDSGDIFELG